MSIPDGFMLPAIWEPGGLWADLVREVLGYDYVTQTDVPLRPRIVSPQHEDHNDDRAVDLFCGRIVPHPGLAEMVEFLKYLFFGEAWAVDQRFVPCPGVVCAAVPDVVERSDPGDEGLHG